MEKGILLRKIFPALIVFSLWLDGWFYPLLLLPFLYVLLVEKKGLGFLGFWRERLSLSILLGLVTAAIIILVYFPIFLYYLGTGQGRSLPSLYTIFTDVVWYPLYEEVAYRAFPLAHFTALGDSPLSSRGFTVNLLQSALFLSIHYKYVIIGQPLVLLPVLLMGVQNGVIFLKTRNVFGCILSHSISNGIALLLPYLMT